MLWPCNRCTQGHSIVLLRPTLLHRGCSSTAHAWCAQLPVSAPALCCVLHFVARRLWCVHNWAR
jgi:hypothetical protein